MPDLPQGHRRDGAFPSDGKGPRRVESWLMRAVHHHLESLRLAPGKALISCEISRMASFGQNEVSSKL
jgi:hypothetical protein